jgi:thiol-disulfide isomerase/thioredoxin
MDPLVSSAAGRAVLLLVLLGIASLVWWLRARRSGDVRSVRAAAPPPPDAVLLDALSRTGVSLGDRATFVQLSSEVCTPCRRTASVLSSLVRDEPGVQHVELDAVEHMDLVRHLGVLRTPTVLLLDSSGRETGRSSGAMTPLQARAALETLVTEVPVTPSQPTYETRQP